MAKSVVLGNGKMLIGLDRFGQVKDAYYHYAGLENHVSGHFCRFGVWVDGRFSWIDASWNKRFGYKRDSLVTEVLLKKSGL